MTQEFVTLPRAVVEQELAALIDKCIATYAIHGTNDYMIVDDGKARNELLTTIRAALEQLQVEQEPVAIPDECPRIIWFDDSDMRPMIFAGRGARDAALKAFERVSVQWNAHLFVRIQKNSRDDQYPCAPLYTNPQPKRETLTDEQSRRIYNSATYSASLAVFMTRIDAEHPDADDKGVSGWLQEAEDRVKHRITEAAHNIK